MPGLIGAGSFNGLTWGLGTKYHISGVSGLDDLPPLRTFDVSRPGDQGEFRGQDLLAARLISLDITMLGDNSADYYTLAEALRAAFALQTAELPLLFFSNSRLIYCRCRRRSVPYDAGNAQRTGTATVELLASDPRIYDATLANLSTGMAQSGGGMTFPATFNLSFGATGAGGLVQVTNTGTFAVRPVLTVTGPVDTPILENLSAGKRLRFNLTLGATDTLIVDLDARTVLLNGTASRRSALSADSQWWELPPGTTTLRFNSAGAFQAAASLAFPFRSAWI
jgi:hypothetical protein